MSRYAGAHVKPNGPGDARPTALQIIKDEGAEGKLKGEVIVITGTSAGIGIQTTRALATTGATLFLTARDVVKAQSALDGIFEPPRMDIIEMDQANLSSVRTAAAAILDKTFKIHLLKLLEPALLAAASPDVPSRVVNLASSAHNVHGINNPDNYNFQKGGHGPSVAYGQSKTANIYMANEIERRYGTHHLHSTSVHPGIVQTGLTKHMPPDAFRRMEFLYPTIKSVGRGAAASYLVNCAVAEPYVEGDDKFSAPGYSPYAYDVEKAKRLWNDSLKLVGLRDDE
ncbi:Short-chain dehydrogenase/reductase SDR [Penicillium cf. griseofulvum]|nr:Short-chain dehydrogenase/reductase SDR [Penicillium cf. griseofulvum]